jgi:hypothetical protein
VIEPTSSQVQTQAAVTTALNDFLTPPATQFGQLITVGDFYNVIMNVSGVEYVVIPVMTREDIIQTGTTNIQMRQSEIPIAGNFVFNTTGGQ